MLKERLKSVPSITAGDVTITIKESPGGFKVVNPLGMFKWLKSLLTDEQLAPALTYPGTRIKEQIAKAMSIPATGKAPMTAKSVFEGGAAEFIEPQTKRMLQFL
jgi:hypothetical protein